MTGLLIDSRCLTFKESYWSFTKLILDNFCSVSLVWHESRTSIAILWFELVDRVEFLSSTPIFGHLSMISTLYQTPLRWVNLTKIVSDCTSSITTTITISTKRIQKNIFLFLEFISYLQFFNFYDIYSKVHVFFYLSN